MLTGAGACVASLPPPPPTPPAPCSPALQNVLLQGNLPKSSERGGDSGATFVGCWEPWGVPVSSCTPRLCLDPALGRAAFPQPGTASTSPWGSPWVQRPSPRCCSFSTLSPLCKAPWGRGTPRPWACDRPGGAQHPSGTPPSCFPPLHAQFGVSHVLPHQLPAIVTTSQGWGPFPTAGAVPRSRLQGAGEGLARAPRLLGVPTLGFGAWAPP